MMSVTCAVSKGNLPINITWQFQDKPIQITNGIAITRTNRKISTLNIDSVSAEHAGTYTCIAKNSAGEMRHSTKLFVIGRSIF